MCVCEFFMNKINFDKRIPITIFQKKITGFIPLFTLSITVLKSVIELQIC
jgi:hypothetical protein